MGNEESLQGPLFLAERSILVGWMLGQGGPSEIGSGDPQLPVGYQCI